MIILSQLLQKKAILKMRLVRSRNYKKLSSISRLQYSTSYDLSEHYLPRIEFYISLAQNYKKSKLNTSINKGNFQVPVFYYEIHKQNNL